MHVVTTEQMRTIEQKVITEYKIPEVILMENAGRSIVDFLKQRFSQLQQMSIVILAGNGNNGGDGLVVARHLYQLGMKVKVFLISEGKRKENNEINLEILKQLPVKVYNIETEHSLHLFKATMNYADLVIDALYGTGVQRELSPLVRDVLQIVNKRTVKRVAVDIPTGLDANTGIAWGCCFHADITIGLGLPKQGYYFNDGIKHCGMLTVVDIGIPVDSYSKEKLDCSILNEVFIKTQLHKRGKDSHKGTFGHLLTVGGMLGMSGAVTLAIGGALRTGVGKVSCAVGQTLHLPVAVSLPEAMVYPLQDNEAGFITAHGMETLFGLMAQKDAIVIGPGYGRKEGTQNILHKVLEHSDVPIVVDADALYFLAEHLQWLKEIEVPVVITPHPGEMARLLGTSVEEIQKNRMKTAKEFAIQYGVWVVLKGANTIIASPKGETYLNVVDSPSLAVSGSGDILAGMIGSFLAQGYSIDLACCLGVNLHGLVGLYLEETIGEISSKASDIVDAIPNVIRGVLQ